MSYGREKIKELVDELGVAVHRVYKWTGADKDDSISKLQVIKNDDSVEVKKLRKVLKKKTSGIRI